MTARAFPRGAVATPHHLATATGAAVLAAGGNAVDAVVAANLTLGVAAPYLCGYGGDLFAMVWDGDLHGYRSAGRSARDATIESVRAATGADRMPVIGPHTVTVPGAVRGWFGLLERWGTRDFAALARPALEYAREGFVVSREGADMFAGVRAIYPGAVDLLAAYPAEATGAGAVLRQPGLARTIGVLGEEGPDAYYRGPIAEGIARTVADAGGTLGLDDLRAHEDAWVEPLRGRFRGTEVCELPPPTQGVAALGALGLVDALDLGGDAPARHHLLIEAVKQALLDRDAFVSDPAAMAVAPSDLLDPSRIARRRGAIDPERAAPLPPAPAADGGTAYLCAADSDGLLVSLIQSNFLAIGSGLHVADWGINLHNRGSSFSLDPAHVNALAPSKLPMHTLVPAMVLVDGRPRLVFGTMGGHGQIQTHVQVLVRWLVDGADVQEAIDAPRWMVDPATWEVAHEDRFDDAWRADLARRGHDLASRRAFDHGMGHAHAIEVLEAGYLAAADPRTESAASGL